MNSIQCSEHDRISAVFPVRESVALLLLALLVLGCYANTFTNPFIFDDIPNILENPYIRIDRIDADSLAEAAFQSPSTRRPLANLSFALNYSLDGYNPRGYHLVNVCIHIASGLLLYAAVKAALVATLKRSSPGDSLPGSESGIVRTNDFSKQTLALPFMAAMLWAVHPLQTQSVTYLVQRMNAMAAMFFLLAFLLFIKAETAAKIYLRLTLYTACAIAGLMALASKENAATLPFFLLLYRWYFTLDLQWRRIRRELVVAALVLIFFAALVYLIMGGQPIDAILSNYALRPFSLPERVLTQFRVVVFYISLLLFPHPQRLNLDPHITISRSILDPPTTILSMGILVGLVAIALCLSKRKRVLSFCILWYLGNLLIESSVIGLELIFEHRNYLPSMAFGLGLAWLLCTKLKSGNIMAIVFVGLTISLAMGTYQRNKVWWDDLTLWQDSAEKSPQKARPANKLGAALERRGRLEEAARYYRQAIQADVHYYLAYFNLGNVLKQQGRTADAIVNYNRALHLKPDFVKARNNLALALASQGQMAEGIRQLETAVANASANTLTFMRLGTFQMQTGNYEGAVAVFTLALEKDPTNADLRYNAGNALIARGRVDDAIVQYQKALKLDPTNGLVYNNLAIALANKGEQSAALRLFQAARRLRPDDENIRHNLKMAREKIDAAQRGQDKLQ